MPFLFYIIPFSFKLEYLSSPIITWSKSSMPNILPHSLILLVISISSLLGVTSPLGWLWVKITLEALLRIAVLKTSLGWTMLVFIDPIDTVFIEVILFLTSKVNKTKCSRSVPSKIFIYYCKNIIRWTYLLIFNKHTFYFLHLYRYNIYSIHKIKSFHLS